MMMYRKFCVLVLLLSLLLTGCTEAATLDPREVRVEEAFFAGDLENPKEQPKMFFVFAPFAVEA